jgi:site-specific DNA recombinase
MSNQPKKAVIYCSSACAEQAHPLSYIVKQETECRLFAEKKGYEIVQVFYDTCYSGLNIHRPSMRLMLVMLLASPEPCAVIATSIERLSRDVSDFASICKIVGGLGGEFLFTSDHTADMAGV